VPLGEDVELLGTGLDDQPPEEPVRARGKHLHDIGRALVGLVLPAVAILAWWGASRSGILPQNKLPAPGAVVESGRNFLLGGRSGITRLPGVIPFDGGARIHLPTSVRRWLTAYLLAVASGMPLGLGLGLSRRFSAALDPFFQGVRSVPITAWLSIALVWFGIGEGSTRFLVFLGAFYPVVIATADASKRVPRQLVDTARMLGTPRRSLARRVYIPAALPGIVTGLRLGLTLGWTSLIIGELTGTDTGLGALIYSLREYGNLDEIIVCMITFAVIGLMGDLILRALTRPLVAWADR